MDDEEIARRDALLEKEIKDFIIEAESSKGGGGESSSVHARVETKPKPAERNRKITKLRVASYGPTKGCDACKYGNDYHTKECRSRFNTLLEGEPIKAPKTPVVGVPKTPVESHEPKVGEGPSSSAVGGADDDYEPSVDGDVGPVEDVMGLISISKGSQVSTQSQLLERGSDVAASILIEAIEDGEDEILMSRRLAEVSGVLPGLRSQSSKQTRNGLLSFVAHPKVLVQRFVNNLRFRILDCLLILVIFWMMVFLPKLNIGSMKRFKKMKPFICLGPFLVVLSHPFRI